MGKFIGYLKFLICAVVCKLASAVGALLRGGTDLPGRIALKICPRALRYIKFNGKVICVTGSNGKTTTSNLIAHVLRENDFRVLNNEKGSNMKTGIASVLLAHCTLAGKIRYDYVILEVDECYARFIFEDITPDYFVVLNLLRDQVVRNGNPDLVFEKIATAVSECSDVTLILNANEPISLNLTTMGRKNIFFGMAETSRSTKSCVSGTNDCKICPQCFSPLEFKFFHYNHLGEFACTGCGYKTPAPDFLASDCDFKNKTLKINGEEVRVTFDTTFNFFNTVAAAAAVCSASELTIEQFANGAKSFDVARDRLDKIMFEGRKCTLMMTKQNAASLDQSISYVLEQEGEKSVVLFVNNVLYLDYKDISWLYDVAFNRLADDCAKILCTGNRALDAAVCLKSFGLGDKLIIETDIKKTKEAFRKTSGDIYILAASAFGHEGRILDELK